jgi:hypothetical protein
MPFAGFCVPAMPAGGNANRAAALGYPGVLDRPFPGALLSKALSEACEQAALAVARSRLGHGALGVGPRNRSEE